LEPARQLPFRQPFSLPFLRHRLPIIRNLGVWLGLFFTDLPLRA